VVYYTSEGKGANMIIGLAGFAQSGKDTLAKILIEEYGFTKIAFADTIRVALYTLNPIVKDDGLRLQKLVDDEGWEKAKLTPEVRRLLQVFGTEVGRSLLGDQVWVELAMRKLVGNGNFVFTDVRFISEAEAIRKHHGFIWRINRDGVEPMNNHSSETELLEYFYDAVIDNNRSIGELRTEVDFLLKK
jgi:hypothetical protein